ncbi:DUF4178 domain-containing protein [Lysobacter sp. KIS68-7]|uniref:DUF4178 domain-containing protein n=1 Tax=Lysobacter sp. KIS68-7 TaxID=2904252 RepID=UPI001E49E540|nr:DUF4178 domain-containing protein [Lysobacter sp. KIS68-7]UHQ18369.1 DUF4178 domain-containing protein [Lysobacter sp. KIS68-7]
MQEVLCPQCGAAVRFESAGAVMVVCGACRSTITKDADVAKTIGHLAAVVEDGSPVRIGTRGRQQDRGFHVVGRLSMQYDAGGWNEWYVLFDDGADGWLSDASGQYALMRRMSDAKLLAPLPAYEDVRVGQGIKIDGVLYYVSDRRESRCIGGEGELPVNAADGWDARAADCRRGQAFATIDYADDAPVIYSGTAAERTDLDPQTLRSKDEIKASTERYRGRVMPLDCPNCGGSVTIAAAMATQVVCPSCSSLLDCSGDRAEIIEANKRAATLKTTLALGAVGKFNVPYTVIGVMRCDVPGDTSEPAWFEYLLFNPEAGYLWLVETEDGWQRVTVSDEWPTVVSDATCMFRGMAWSPQYDYRARVTAVFGAFNWRVRRGDSRRVTDFKCQKRETLTREQTDDEITWSLASAIPEASVRIAFGLPKAVRAPVRAAREETDDDDVNVENATAPSTVAWIATVVFFVLSESISMGAFWLGLALVWAPVAFLYAHEEAS